VKLINDTGIVLYRSRFADEDIRTKIFLKTGGKALLSIKSGLKLSSKLKSLTEPFTEADYQLYLPPHSPSGRVIGGRPLQSFQYLKSNVPAFSIASQCCETIELLFPFRGASAQAYDLLQNTLKTLNTPDLPTIEWPLFIFQLIHVLGHGDYSPDIIKSLSPSEKAAFEHWTDRGQPWERHRFPQWSPETAQKIVRIMENQLNFLLPKPLKSRMLAEALVSRA
jgi:recombinational DNA repair protein (RecF pathway)